MLPCDACPCGADGGQPILGRNPAWEELRFQQGDDLAVEASMIRCRGGLEPLMQLIRKTFQREVGGHDRELLDWLIDGIKTQLRLRRRHGCNQRGSIPISIWDFIRPNCMPQPPGTVRLMRKYNPARDDHAIFPETVLGDMLQEGYTMDSGSDWLGDVYPNINGERPKIQ